MRKGKAIRKLDSTLAKREAGKSQAKIGDVRQLRKTLRDLEVEHWIQSKRGKSPINIIQDSVLVELKRRLKARERAQ